MSWEQEMILLMFFHVFVCTIETYSLCQMQRYSYSPPDI